MIGKFFLKYRLVVQLLLVVFSLLLILISALSLPSGAASTITVSVGTSALAGTLLSLLDSGFGIDLPSMFKQMVDFRHNIFDLGLDNIHLKVGDDSIYSRFIYAHSIDLLYTSANYIIKSYGEDIKAAVKQRGCKVRILIADIDNEIWNNVQIRRGLGPIVNFVNDLEVTGRLLRELMKEIKPYTIEARVYKMVLTGNMVIVNKSHARFIPYLPYTDSANVPELDVLSERGGKLFDSYQDTFERIWNNEDTTIFQ